MSQLLLLRRISKLTLTKKPISACFSTARTSRSKPPYLLLDTDIHYKGVLNFHLYDLTKNKEVVKEITDQSKTLKKFEKSLKIGSSRSHLVLRNKKGSRVYLVDISSNKLEPKIITLPQLHIDKDERDVNYNVSVSSPVNGEIIVAAKFKGSRLSLCRVGDSEWTRIDVPCPSFEDSSLIYSERDKRFYLNNRDRNYTGLIDLTPKSGLVTPVSGYPFPISNLAEFEKDVMTHPHFRFKEQLVKSPSGQSFIVCWVTCHFTKKGEMVSPPRNVHSPWTKEKTQKIVVYKQDEEEEIYSYSVTKDIGDLCIFIGANESFCVTASDYSGLKPNSVYFAGCNSDFGVCDLFSQTILNFLENVTPNCCRSKCWIPPTFTLTC